MATGIGADVHHGADDEFLLRRHRHVVAAKPWRRWIQKSRRFWLFAARHIEHSRRDVDYHLVFLKAKVSWREAFGLNHPNLKKSFLSAVGVLLLALPVVWLCKRFPSPFARQTGRAAGKPARGGNVFEATNHLGADLFWVFAIVIAPVAEEFIFRGILYPFVKLLGSPKLAFFGVSAIFAEIHFDAGTLVPLFVLALVLTWLYEKTHNLLASITAHSLFNTVNLVALYFRSN